MTPSVVLAAIPKEPVTFKDFFGSKGPRELLEKPGGRYAGWDMQTHDTARIVRGEYLEVRNGDRKQIQLYEDGTLLGKFAADDRFLAWGSEARAPGIRLNPLALLEVLYSFVRLYGRLTAFLQPVPREATLRVQIEGALSGDETSLGLGPYGVDTYAWMLDDERQGAPEASMTREIRAQTVELQQEPGLAAYELAEKIYLWFGHAPDKVPYTMERDGKKAVDPSQFERKR
jgi:hypothetical protein